MDAILKYLQEIKNVSLKIFREPPKMIHNYLIEIDLFVKAFVKS